MAMYFCYFCRFCIGLVGSQTYCLFEHIPAISIYISIIQRTIFSPKHHGYKYASEKIEHLRETDLQITESIGARAVNIDV